jgi:hypothetical protein
MPQREVEPSPKELTNTMLDMTPEQISAFPWHGTDDEGTAYLTKLWRDTRSGGAQ